MNLIVRRTVDRPTRYVCVLTLLLGGIPAVASWGGQAASEDSKNVVDGGTAPAGESRSGDPLAEIEALVAQLGAPSFRLRELAMKQLAEYGRVAVPALQRGARDRDREIRQRSARLLVEIDLLHREERIAVFLAGGQEQSDTMLPGWAPFAELVGDTPETRAVFASMLEEEWDLLAALTYDGPQIEEVFRDRLNAFQVALPNRRVTQLNFPSILTMLFVGADTRVKLAENEILLVSSLAQRLSATVRRPPSDAKVGLTTAEVYRKLVDKWLKREVDGNALYGNMSLAISCELPEAASLGLRYAEVTPTANSRAIAIRKSHAIMAVARFGSAEHTQRLKPLLEDVTVTYEERDPKSKQSSYSVQVRDVALAALMKLDGMDPKENGFTRLAVHPVTVYTSNTIGFTTDELRAAARKAWEEHQK